MSNGKKTLTPAEEMDLIRKKKGSRVFERPVAQWLNTGNRRLNAVLGSEEKGLAYGRMIELYGPNSHGKTMIALFIAALAQRDGAEIAWVDLEQSFEKEWVDAQGVEYDKVYPFVLELGYHGGEKEPRLETAEEMFERVELWMKRRYMQNPSGRILIVIDSVAAILTEKEAESGLAGGLPVNMALPAFLSRFLRQWMAKVAVYNAMVILINQIRDNPMAFGNSEHAPGGNASKHYCSVRATVRRVKGGRLVSARRVIGLRGVIKNIKNKVGGGSLEGAVCGYQTLFGKKSWKFMTEQEVRKEPGDRDDDEKETEE